MSFFILLIQKEAIDNVKAYKEMQKKSLARCSRHTTATISKIQFRSEARTGIILHMAFFFLVNM